MIRISTSASCKLEVAAVWSSKLLMLKSSCGSYGSTSEYLRWCIAYLLWLASLIISQHSWLNFIKSLMLRIRLSQMKLRSLRHFEKTTKACSSRRHSCEHSCVILWHGDWMMLFRFFNLSIFYLSDFSEWIILFASLWGRITKVGFIISFETLSSRIITLFSIFNIAEAT
jgi:hypothetical protein